jgi:hypothetical protein
VIRGQVKSAVRRLTEIAGQEQSTCCDLLDWLRVEHGIEMCGLIAESVQAGGGRLRGWTLAAAEAGAK